MRSSFNFVTTLFFLILVGCEDENLITVPLVKTNETFDVLLEEDVIYAKGLSHQSLNSIESTELDLKLDIYYPDNDIDNRPLFMFMHGGGFKHGTKQGYNLERWGNFFASRGWVFISIDYRLMRDLGTVPQEWIDYSSDWPADFIDWFLAVYPAHRDSKAALRWIIANSTTYGINQNYITVGGDSAGAQIAISLGVSNLGDYTDEINTNQDPTLITTNLSQTYKIKTIVDYWGSKIGLDILDSLYGYQRFDSNDPALFIAHGMRDTEIPISLAEELKKIYQDNQAPFVYYPLQDYGHGAWLATVDKKSLEELTFNFIVEQQKLIVE